MAIRFKNTYVLLYISPYFKFSLAALTLDHVIAELFCRFVLAFSKSIVRAQWPAPLEPTPDSGRDLTVPTN